MQTLKISRTDDIQRVIEKAKKKFGRDKEFTLVEWPDNWPFGSIRLIMTDRKEIKVEKKKKGKGEKDQKISREAKLLPPLPQRDGQRVLPADKT